MGPLYKEEKLLLRWAGALEDKYKKLSEYREAGIVKADEALFIAIFQGGISQGRYIYRGEL